MLDLLTVDQIAEEYPFSVGQVRRWLYERRANGLSKAIVKPTSQRLYIKRDAFEAWLEARTEELES